MILIVLAAGKGSRLPTNFRKKPKCMVKINGKFILEYNLNFYNKFKNKFIVTGYKRKYLKNFIKENNFKEIYNNNFYKTNMVESIFLTKKFINDDVVIVYGDIIFSDQVFKLLKKRKNIILANSNWYKNWVGRMGKKYTLIDAESFKEKKNKLIEIGGKLEKNKLPKCQFMGIVKVTARRFKRLYSLYKLKKNNKMDFTTLINLSIKIQKTVFNVKKYNKKWFEIDSGNDIKYAGKNLK